MNPSEKLIRRVLKLEEDLKTEKAQALKLLRERDEALKQLVETTAVLKQTKDMILKARAALCGKA